MHPLCQLGIFIKGMHCILEDDAYLHCLQTHNYATQSVKDQLKYCDVWATTTDIVTAFPQRFRKVPPPF